jgi:hypothetical protein
MRQHCTAHHTSAYVSIRQHMSAYVSMRQHTCTAHQNGDLLDNFDTSVPSLPPPRAASVFVLLYQ